MNDKTPKSGNEATLFLGFFLEAFRALPGKSSALFFAFLTVCFGSDFLSLFQEKMPLSGFASAFSDFLTIHPAAFLLLIPVFAASVIFRTGLLVALDRKNARIAGTFRSSFRIFPRAILLEVSFILALSVLAFLLISPSMAAKGSLLPGMLRLVGELLFLGIAMVLLFTKTFAFFHVVLSRTDVRPALELGYGLFRKRSATSIVFGFVSILFSIAVSVILTALLSVTTTVIRDETARIVLSTIVALGALSLHSATQKQAWLSFFRFIATPSEPDIEAETSQDSEKVIQREVPETGQASEIGRD